MTYVEILEHLKHLPATDRLKIVESTVHQLRKDLECSGTAGYKESSARLSEAAKALLNDYTKDGELTAFTALDGEAFHV